MADEARPARTGEVILGSPFLVDKGDSPVPLSDALAPESPRPLIFPPWVNRVRLLPLILPLVGLIYVAGLFAYAAAPRATDVGYAPEQPVAYSHAIHAGKLGMDCRYCHSTVEMGSAAAIPPTQTCLNCHAKIRTDSVKLALVRDSALSGMPIKWVRVHDLPDYVYFDHSAHVRRRIGCVSCHGRVDQMEVVRQVQPLSMGWCLDCHRAPEKHLRRVEDVTNMSLSLAPEEQLELGRKLVTEHDIHPSTDCSTCHR